MDQKTSLRFQLISAWCGPAFLFTFVMFWGVIGRNIPNPSPALSAADLAARYSQHLGEIRLGFIVALITVASVYAVVFVYQRPDGANRGRVPGIG